LSTRARAAIRNARDETVGIAIAIITVWEMAWLAENGRIQVWGSVESLVRETVTRVILKPIMLEIAALAVRLPAGFPRDPADRLIACTAITEGAALVTSDARIRQANVVQIIW
jgi:PIN domain nuclease of toxin-antitoxin system